MTKRLEEIKKDIAIEQMHIALEAHTHFMNLWGCIEKLKEDSIIGKALVVSPIHFEDLKFAFSQVTTIEEYIKKNGAYKGRDRVKQFE